MSDIPTSLVERRWDAHESPAEHRITDMLRVAIDRIERGDMDPRHAILALGNEHDDGSISTEFFQAGSFNAFAQIGLVTRVAQTMLEKRV